LWRRAVAVLTDGLQYPVRVTGDTEGHPLCGTPSRSIVRHRAAAFELRPQTGRGGEYGDTAADRKGSRRHQSSFAQREVRNFRPSLVGAGVAVAADEADGVGFG